MNDKYTHIQDKPKKYMLNAGMNFSIRNHKYVTYKQ